MKSLIIVIVYAAGVAIATKSSEQCKSDFAEFSQAYVKKANGIVHANTVDLDLDGLEKCINSAARGCGQSVSKELGADYADVPPEKLESCADKSMGDAQDKMQDCLKDEFPGVDFGTKQEQKDSPGLRLIVLLGTLKQTYKTCRDVSKCIPTNYKDLKSQLCKAETETFGKDFERRCPDIKDDVRTTTCSCYKQIPDKDNIVKDFNTCCGVEENRSLISRVGSRVAQGGILKKIESKVCKDDYTAKFGICEDSELEKAQKTSNTLGRLNQLVNGGSGDDSIVNRFGGFFG